MEIRTRKLVLGYGFWERVREYGAKKTSEFLKNSEVWDYRIFFARLAYGERKREVQNKPASEDQNPCGAENRRPELWE